MSKLHHTHPPSLQVLSIFLSVRGAFPHATVTAGGFDPFVSDLVDAAPGLNLPVVTAEVCGGGVAVACTLLCSPMHLSHRRLVGVTWIAPPRAGPSVHRSLPARAAACANCAPSRLSCVSLASSSLQIGDTWIYGIASDPARLAEYRALLRMRRASIERYDDPAFQAFSRMLLKLRWRGRGPGGVLYGWPGGS